MTARQFYIMLGIFVVMTKMQRFPSLLFNELGKDGYILILFYAIVNIALILLAFFIYKFLDREDFKNKKSHKFAFIIKKITMLATSVYFIIQALLLFEHVQNIFADTLFDRFAWSVFSLLFLFAIFYLAKTGIKNIAINYELFSVIIIGALGLISILGAVHSDYSFILPFQTINIGNIADKIFEFNTWFGDFFIILFMLVHTKKPKLSKTLLIYVISMLSVLFLTITFFGVYRDYTALQPGMISSITEQSMLGMNIGRVDWFLILFAEIGTILSCSVCIYFANKTLSAVFPKIKPLYLSIIIAVAFYVMNVFVLVDKYVVREFFFGIGGYISLGLKLFATIILLIMTIVHYIEKRKKKSKEARSGEVV